MKIRYSTCSTLARRAASSAGGGVRNPTPDSLIRCFARVIRFDRRDTGVLDQPQGEIESLAPARCEPRAKLDGDREAAAFACAHASVLRARSRDDEALVSARAAVDNALCMGYGGTMKVAFTQAIGAGNGYAK